jgi:hypothetical protein
MSLSTAAWFIQKPSNFPKTWRDQRALLAVTLRGIVILFANEPNSRPAALNEPGS